MADEFAKGLGLLTGAGLIWMVLAGWYRTPSFDGGQLVSEVPSGLGAFGQLGVQVMNAMFWLAVFGAVIFWVAVPVGRQVYASVSGE